MILKLFIWNCYFRLQEWTKIRTKQACCALSKEVEKDGVDTKLKCKDNVILERVILFLSATSCS